MKEKLVVPLASGITFLLYEDGLEVAVAANP
jgi:hypothetical protein